MKIGKEKSLSPYNSAQNWSCPIYHLDLLMPAISPGSTAVTVCVLVAKLCLTLCDLMDCSPPGSSVHGISQARTLEWVATSFFSRRSSWTRDRTHISSAGRRIPYH